MEKPTADVLLFAQECLQRGSSVAVAVVARTWRSSPRPVGSLLVVDSEGRFEGSVSGGCVEGAVVQLAAAVLQDGVARSAEYGVASEDAMAVGLPCGGTIEVWVAPFPAGVVKGLNRAARERQALFWTLSLAGGSHALWQEEGLLGGESSAHGRPTAAVQSVLPEPRASGLLELEQEPLLGVALEPPLRLLLVGAVHLAQALVPLAAMAGFSVVVIDPRSAFARPERFSDVTLSSQWPDEAIDSLAPDAGTAVVVLSHDGKLDDPALLAALRSDCFYVGALGSRRTHAARLQRLIEAGCSERALARIHAPVGLAIGARTTSEIAISIIAEIVAVRRSRLEPPSSAAAAPARSSAEPEAPPGEQTPA